MASKYDTVKPDKHKKKTRQGMGVGTKKGGKHAKKYRGQGKKR